MFRLGDPGFRYLISWQHQPATTGEGGSSGTGTGEGSGGGSGAGTNGERQPDNNGGDPARLSLTTEQLNERIARARDQGARDALNRQQADADQALADQRRFEELATTRQTVIEQLQTQVTDLNTRLEAAEASLTDAQKTLQRHVDELTKEIPEHIRKLLSKMSLQEQMDYLAEHHDDLAKPRNSAVPATAQADGRGSGGSGEDDALAVFLNRRYGKREA